MHSWTSSYQGPTPGAGWTPPQRSSGVGKYFLNIILNNAKRFCKKNFVPKCIPEPIPIRVLPLGQGECPPEVKWGLKKFSKYSWEQCKQVL